MPKQYRPYPADPVQSVVSRNFVNRKLIADDAMHRIMPINKEEFKVTLEDFSLGITIPDTLVGARGVVNEVGGEASEMTLSTQDHALKDPIPQSHIDAAAGSKFNPVTRSTEQLTNLILLDREVRVSNLMSNPANYLAANVVPLAAGSKFSDADFNPIPLIMDMLAVPLMRPNVLSFSEAAINALTMNPFIVKAAHGNSGDAGIASFEAIRKLFRVDKILVGEARVNVARKGQAADIKTAWGNNDVSMTYQDTMADNRSGTTWGLSVPYKQRIAMQWHDKKIGARGGTMVQVVEGMAEVVIAKELGILLQNVI